MTAKSCPYALATAWLDSVPLTAMTDSTHPAGADDSEVVTTATGPTMRDRFRGFLPVVVDIETGGFNCQTDAILEIAMTLLKMSEDGQLEMPRPTAATWNRLRGKP